MEENANDLHNTSRESLPEYENPGHHDPKATNFNKEKSVLPENHIELFEKSVLGPDGNRWTKVGAGKKSVYHRFQDDGNGKWHWNGSSNAMLKNNKPNPIKEQNIPIEIKRLK